MNFAAFHAFDDNTLLIARCCPRIKLPHKMQVKEGLSLNEQYNTRNAVSLITNEAKLEMKRHQPKNALPQVN